MFIWRSGSVKLARELEMYAPPAARLTRREREIASLISRDLTNRKIGLELSIKERTAGAHVQNPSASHRCAG